MNAEALLVFRTWKEMEDTEGEWIWESADFNSFQWWVELHELWGNEEVRRCLSKRVGGGAKVLEVGKDSRSRGEEFECEVTVPWLGSTTVRRSARNN